jgi:hypothetical protein
MAMDITVFRSETEEVALSDASSSNSAKKNGLMFLLDDESCGLSMGIGVHSAGHDVV